MTSSLVLTVLTSLAVGFTCVMSFMTSHTYMDMKMAMQLEGVFWLYGAFSLAGLVFVVIWVPETKGKSEAEIQEYFDPKPKT
jgi:facilitated trehalose transporter